MTITVDSTTGSPELDPAAQESWKCDFGVLMSGVDEVVNSVIGPGAPTVRMEDDVWNATLVYSTIVSSTATRTGETEFVYLEQAEYPDDHIDYRSFEPKTFYDDGETIVLAEAFETQAGTRSRVLNLLRIGGDGEPTFADGPCAEPLAQDLSAMSSYLDIPAEEVLRDWVAAPVDPKTGETEYALILDDVRQQSREDAADAVWESADPQLRSLTPGDVPERVRVTLDVRAIQLAVEIPDDLVLVVRTGSGGSGAVAGNVLPIVQPTYFTPTDKVVEIVFAKSASDLEGQVIARIPTQDLRDQAGAIITGSIDSPTVTMLTSEQLAEILGLSDIDDLERMRLSLLESPYSE